MAFVSGISIYPVKSLDPQHSDCARIMPSGALEHDRTFAMVDATGGFVNGKRYAAVHRLRSRMDKEHQALTLRDEGEHGSRPETFRIHEERDRMEAWLSDIFGVSISWKANPICGFPDDLDSPGPTIISTATLTEIGSWFGLTIDQARARFRTNIEIDGVPPVWEDRLFGAAGSVVRFRLGDVGFEGINPCQRCVVPLRDPWTGIPDNTFVRRFTELRNRLLPAWSQRGRFNHFYRVAINTRIAADQDGGMIRVGDPVDILDAPSVAADIGHRPSDFWAGELEIERVTRETDAVKTFRLRHPTRKGLPFRFRPGQFLTITTGDGPEHLQRCYTIASSPSHEGFCEITIKRDGIASTALHRLGPGSRLGVSGPMGSFVFEGRDADEIVLIAGGVGITPLMSVLRFLVDDGWPGRIDLIYSVKTSRDIIFHAELMALQRVAPGLRLHITVTSDDADWTGPRGRISTDWIRAAVPDIAGRQVRMCGPPAMTGPVQRMLRQLGVGDARIEIEAFGRSEPVASAFDGTDQAIRFARSGQTGIVRAGQTLLDAALAAGLALDHGCRSGVCGRCKARLLEGDVTMDCDFVLTGEQKAAGMILTCQARPCGPVAIDI